MRSFNMLKWPFALLCLVVLILGAWKISREPKMADIPEVSDGVRKEIIKEGDGPNPNRGQTITVQCTGSLQNPPIGPPTKFWSTKDPGQQPFTFQVGLGKVIQGWDQGCLTMKKGEIAKLYIRADKGYGVNGFPAWGIGPNADLLFEIEILTIQ